MEDLRHGFEAKSERLVRISSKFPLIPLRTAMRADLLPLESAHRISMRRNGYTLKLYMDEGRQL